MSDYVIAIVSRYQIMTAPLWRLSARARGIIGCRFHPSCSQYAKDAVRKYGVIRGLFKSAIRILRCNPLSRGGIDEA